MNTWRSKPFNYICRCQQIWGTFKLLWKCKVPTKVLTFSWQMLQERVPAKSNLARRGLTLTAEQQRCVLCNRAADTELHSFFTCQLVHSLWTKMYGWLDISVVLPSSSFQHFLQHRGLFKGKEMKTGECLFGLFGLKGMQWFSTTINLIF